MLPIIKRCLHVEAFKMFTPMRSGAYLIFVIFFTHTHFESWKLYTKKCVNLRQNCPATKQRKSPPQTYISIWTNHEKNGKTKLNLIADTSRYINGRCLYQILCWTDILYTFRELDISLSVELHNKCKILHWVQHYTLNVKLHTEFKITHQV